MFEFRWSCILLSLLSVSLLSAVTAVAVISICSSSDGPVLNVIWYQVPMVQYSGSEGAVKYRGAGYRIHWYCGPVL